MTRKINLSHLSKNECDRILAVIQRDANLRQKEQERLSKIEEELNDRASQRSVLAKRKEFNEKWCILCCSTFNLLFNKKLYCHDCHFYVCRSCAVWQSQEKVWLCRLCEHQRVLYIQSCEWFYDHVRKKFKHFGSSKIFIKALCKKRKESDSENDSGYGPTSETSMTSKSLLALFSHRMHSELKQEEPGDASSITGSHCSHTEEEDVGEVRQHVETVVEGLIGSSSLDMARVDYLYDNTSYDQLFTKYHPQLSTAAGLLANTLHRAMQNDISENEVTPTAAHAALKELIVEVTDKARTLPQLKEIDDSSQSNNKISVLSDNYNQSIFTTYNDLLAAAIINKIIEIQQQKLYKEDNAKPSGEEMNKFIGTTHSNESSSDEENEARNSKELKEDFSWDENLSKPQSCVEYVIEEIEEIMQECTDSEEDESSKMSLPSSNQSINDASTTKSVITRTDEIPDLDVLSELDVTAAEKVPFPELGMDIVEINEDQQIDEEPRIDSCVMSVSAWEENWLFRRKRFPLYSSLGMRLMASYNDPPSMVIPNPADDAQVLIGARELDQLSELSEINSVGSLEYSSDDSFENKDGNVETKFPNHIPNAVGECKMNDSQKLQNNYFVQSDAVPKYNSHQLSYKDNSLYLGHLNGLVVPNYSSQACRKSSVPDPTFVEVPENQTLHAGKRACFTCHAAGTKPISVAWFYNKQQLLPGPKYNMCCIVDKHMLEIYNTTVSDSGTYSCVVFNNRGENWKDFTLKLKDSSRAEILPEFAVSLRMLNCALGENTKLTCTVSGYPEPRLHVFFNSQEIENSTKYKIYSTGYGEWVIEITNFEIFDQGEYVVVATNKLGQASSMISLANSFKESSERIVSTNTNIHTTSAEEKENDLYKAKGVKSFTECRNVLSPKHTLRNANEHLLNLENERNDTNDLNIPPKPGTIAEREHKKWLNAVPLSNNPYSAANLAKRLGRRQLLSLGLLPSVSRSFTYEELENQQLQDSYGTNGNVSTICSPVDPSRYQRDYYINHISNNNNKQKIFNLNANLGSLQETEDGIFHESLGNEEALNSLEEKVYISAGKVFTLENHVRRLEREIQSVTNLEDIAFLEKQTSKAVATATKNDQQIFQLERDIVHLQKSTKEQRCMEKKGILTEVSSHSDEFPSLPSVKDLATKFTPPTCTKAEVPPQSVKISPPEKKVVMVEKVLRNLPHDDPKEKQKPTAHSSRMVHSLTARNLPREFRKQARDHLPKPMNRTIFLKGSDNSTTTYLSNMNTLPDNNDSSKKGSESAAESFHGYTSDESTASNSSLSLTKPKRKTSQSILQRASYWEKRAEQNLLSDSSVSEDFPAMKNLPD